MSQKKQELPDGCIGIIIFSVLGSVLGFGCGLLMFSFLQAVGLSIISGFIGGFIGFLIGNCIERK
jgi:uncharacterized membrane protein YeiH